MAQKFIVNAAEQFHALAAVTLAIGGPASTAGGEVVARGATVTITDDLIRASRDRNGNSWLDWIDNPEAQIARWGEVKLAPGPWPEKTESWIHGDPVWEHRRAKAQAAAWAIQDERERALAFKRLHEVYGASLPTSRTTQQLDGGLPGGPR